VATTERRDEAAARSRDVNVRWVFLFIFWLAAAAVVIQLAMWGLFRVLSKEERARDRRLPPMVEVNLRRTPPEPRLEPRPLVPRLQLRQEENAVLETYGWVDRNRGVVRVPIRRAMEILVERGLPPSKPMPATAPLPAPGAVPPLASTPVAATEAGR
jgi:hypothetical protein